MTEASTIQERAREAAEQVHFNASLHSSTENAITQIADDLTAFARAEVERELETLTAAFRVQPISDRERFAAIELIQNRQWALKESGQ